MPESTMFSYTIFSIVPVVSALDLILQPFSLSVTVESEKVIPETVLSLFPPTEPILKPLKRPISASLLYGLEELEVLTVHPSKSFQ